MKAAVIEKYGSLVIRDVPEPSFGDYGALCELLYGSTCSGTDTHIIDGRKPFTDWLKLPLILGHESVGRVIKVGSKVRNYKIGDLVTRVGAPETKEMHVGWGGYTQMGVAIDHWAMAVDGRPAGEWSGARVNQVLPTGISPLVAPMFTTWRETLSGSLRMGVAAGSSVLVAGSGGNGLSFAMHAHNLGVSTLAMVGAQRLESLAKSKFGVQHYVDYKTADLAASLNQAVPAGFDFIIDAVGKIGTADQLLPALKAGGRYMTYGVDDLGSLTVNFARARGAFTIMPCSYDETETHGPVSDAVLTGKLDASLWYDLAHPCPLSSINDAFDAVRKRKVIKCLIDLQK